jgi:hypothetical protein
MGEVGAELEAIESATVKAASLSSSGILGGCTPPIADAIKILMLTQPNAGSRSKAAVAKRYEPERKFATELSGVKKSRQTHKHIK